MPDLVTHLCTALLPKAITGGRHTGAFAVGAALPDIGSRLPSLFLEKLYDAGWPIPAASMHPFTVLHMPVGAFPACILLAMLFPERDRVPIARWLCAGVALHLGFDLFQAHHGDEGYPLLFPLSPMPFELKWMSAEATVPWAPWLALVTAAAWAARLAWNARRTKEAP